MPNFKKRYVLGVGYPYQDEETVALGTTQFGTPQVLLLLPKELDVLAIPQYRLVLERVEDDTD